MNFSPEDVTKELWDKLAGKGLVNGYWSRTHSFGKRMAAKVFLQLWLDAAERNDLKNFEDMWDARPSREPQSRNEQPQKRPRSAEGSTAVAECASTASEGSDQE